MTMTIITFIIMILIIIIIMIMIIKLVCAFLPDLLLVKLSMLSLFVGAQQFRPAIATF